MMEERNRLARELHDTVKQQTFATLMQVRAAKNLLEQRPGRRPAAPGARPRALIKTSQQELGLIIAELRPAALEGQGLARRAARLPGHLVAACAHPGRLPGAATSAALPLEVEQALYRVAQEALSNVARHSRASAGDASGWTMTHGQVRLCGER